MINKVGPGGQGGRRAKQIATDQGTDKGNESKATQQKKLYPTQNHKI